ncbi:MAG: Hsp33 family molecular chaperone HslO [Alphaproteobacteria bacterium]|nr:Hsp33 family molecular chaperone HslO [Alphaproteobacteria bacterium]
MSGEGTGAPMSGAPDDLALPFALPDLGARGRIVRLGPAVDAILRRHEYPPPVAALLGESLALCVALASSLKYEGIFTLQMRGDGPVRLLVVDLTSDGALRGYAQFNAEKVAAMPVESANAVPRLLGRGHMAFTVDQGADTERYQGVVALEGSSLSDCAHHYFRQSEQLATGIKLTTGRDDAGHWRAGGLILQALPSQELIAETDAEERDERFRTALILMGSARESEMLDPALPADQLLWRLFHEHAPRVFEQRDVADRCRCSRARIDSVLGSIPREELNNMRDPRGLVAVRCEFCGARYDYDDAQLAALGSRNPA